MKRKTYSDHFKPCLSLKGDDDTILNLHYLTYDKKFGFSIGLVINGKEQWDVCISPKGRRVRVYKTGDPK